MKRRFRQVLPPVGITLPVLAVVLSVYAASWAGSALAAQPFEIQEFAMTTTERTEQVAAGGGLVRFVNVPYSFTQAGGHPWGLTTRAAFKTEEFEGQNGSAEKLVVPTHEPRDIVGGLPPGLLGNPVAVPRCPLTLVTSSSEQCPADTQIGVSVLHWQGGKDQLAPIVNVTPEAGQSAEFAIENHTKAVTPLLTAHLVRTADGEYGFTVASNEIPLVALSGFELTFWGVPADPSHDPMRGRFCGAVHTGEALSCTGGGERSGLTPVPFLTLPTDCSAGAETATLRADAWDEPGSVREGKYTKYIGAATTMPGVTGCDLLKFDPSILVQPDKSLADEPVGLGVTLGVPQNEEPASTATPQLRDASVTLPEGLSISPGIVDGIQACDESGPNGINFSGGESEEVGLSGELQLAAGHCPSGSTVGTAEAITPLLPEPVKGHIYLARPLCGGAGQDPCTVQDALDGHLYQLYLELGGVGPLANTGINIKAHGFVEANPATGQLTTVFEDNPQAPFSELHVNLNGGPRASLDNPAVCGPAITTTDFKPWSAPGETPEGLLMAGTPDAAPSSFYEVTGCSNPPQLAPGFVAGTVTALAGQFSAFTLDLTRQDREQFVKGVQVHTPPGLLGMLSSVTLCGQAEADSGTCGEASHIGETRAASGAGSHPFEIGGDVYLTGPYRGAPFGLSIVVHVVAGPFNLGVVVVRARIEVDPTDSTLMVTTDETGPHAVPQIVFGVPVRLKRITVAIDRPNFMFNPTDCTALKVTAVISGAQDAVAHVSSPFAVGGCKSLAFKPKFTAFTSGKTSRTKGASLDAKLSYPPGSLGSASDIAKVKVDLPKQLPSRLTTLQKACPAATFDADPAGCPGASIVGIVRSRTPLLSAELTGPVYFVSHGGQAFPSLIVVLQGEGVRVDLAGTTFISKAGITSTTFETVPDVPVDSFEIYLPEGKNSALAANGNLCKQASKLRMPTRFTAQNGAVLKQNTKIVVTGCKTIKAKTKRGRGKGK